MTVLCNGCFDMFHPGHMHLLRQASELGDRLIVAVNDDDYIRREKGREPLVPLDLRIEFIAYISFVDCVYCFSDEECLKNIVASSSVDIIVKGTDWVGKDITGSDITQVVFVPLLEGWSTTELIKRIKDTH